jgi:hypothetical protein
MPLPTGYPSVLLEDSLAAADLVHLTTAFENTPHLTAIPETETIDIEHSGDTRD